MSTSHTLATRGRLNLFVTIGAMLVIAVLVNVLFSRVRARLDLTANGINELSAASREAVAALEGLEVRVYISPDLPTSIPAGPGNELKLQGLPQKLGDKLAEYAAYGNAMTITQVTEDLIGEAERNRLRTFSGKGGALSDAGQFEFRKYALGLSFHYKTQVEVLELALQPEHYEFEITRRLIRLKDKAEFAVTLKDMLEAAGRVADGVKACTDALKDADKEGGAANPLAMVTGEGLDKKLAALKATAPAIRSACESLGESVAAAQAVKSDVDAYRRLLTSAEALTREAKAFMDAVEAPEPPQLASLVAARQQLVTYGQNIDREVQAVEDSPGQRRIGFVCNAETFCPFPDTTPLIPKEVADSVTAQPGMGGRIIAYLKELEERVTSTLQQVNAGLFRGRGFEIVRVDLDAPLPPDLTALVVYGPTGDFTDWQLWQLDQFVVRGGSLVAFLNAWDVMLQPIGKTGQLEKARMTKRSSNFNALLAHFGIAPTGALVAEPTTYGEVSLMRFLQQGAQLVPIQLVSIPYPMLPTFSDMDVDDPLVRATPTLTLPFTTWFQLKPQAGAEAVALVRSSPAAASVDRADFPLDPGQQLEAASAEPKGGAMTVVAAARGELSSYFKGRGQPAAPGTTPDEATAATTRRDSGRGRVLAIGSNLGITSLGRDVVFAGFTPEELTSQDPSLVAKVEGFRGNFETWSSRVDQVSTTLQGNLQFLHNVLDWAVQRDAVAELRARQYAERPLRKTEAGERQLFRVLALAISPALLFAFGALWAARRRGRKRRLAQ